MTQTASTSDFSDHADFYQRGPYARYLTDRKVVGREPVAMFSAEQPAGNFPDPAMPTVLLYLAQRGARNANFNWGAGRWRGAWRNHDLTLVPPDTASEVSLSDRHSFLGLCLPVSMFADEQDATGRDTIEQLGTLFAAPFRDVLIKELIATLWRQGDCGNLGYSMLADSALQCLVDRLRYLAHASMPQQTRSCLSLSILNKVDDFIHARLNDPIKVAELAAVAGLSPSHFTLLFKHTTGRTPYRHVLALRVERANGLIAAFPERGLADIAIESGFSSQSHMTSIFRQVIGATPGNRR